MSMTTQGYRKRAGLLLTLALCGAWPAIAAESFAYKVTYDGMFTAFKQVGIGDARLDIVQTGAVVDAEPVVRARLTASSAAYPLVENFYPFRYELTSYHQHRTTRTLAYERRKQTRRTRHDLLVADWDAESVRRFDIDPSSAARDDTPQVEALLAPLRRAGLPDYRSQLAPHPVSLQAPVPALDRLALLLQIRSVAMHQDAVYPLTVTDGKEIIRYQARVARREQVMVGDTTRTAWKIRIDGFEAADAEEFATSQEGAGASVSDDAGRLRHPPVYVWIDDGPRRVPLRLVSHHAVGTFAVTLDAERTQQLAGLDPGRGTPHTN